MTSSNKRKSALGFGPRGANRMDFSGKEKDKLFLSDAGKKMVDVSYLGGIDSPQDGRVFATSDLDHDGAEELIVVYRNAPILRVYERSGWEPGTRWIGLQVRGGEGAPRDGTGATVTVTCGGRSITRAMQMGAGFATQNSRALTIGVGSCETVEKIAVKWITPQGVRERVFEDKPTREMFTVALDDAMRHVPGYYARANTPAHAVRAPAGAPGRGLLASMRAGTLHGPSGTRGAWRPKREYVYVDLWATWCEACKRSQPALDALASRFAGRIDFVGLPLDPADDPAKVAEWAKGVTERVPVLAFDSAAHARAIEAAMPILGGKNPPLPSALVLDRATGEVLLRSTGVPTASDLEALLARRDLAMR